MTRRPLLAATRRWGAVLALALLVAGCGKKGPPLPPLQLAPARIGDLTARRLADDVYLTFTVPDRNTDGSMPADLVAVDVLAITGEPVDVNGQSLSARDLVRELPRVLSIDVQPPVRPGDGAAGDRRAAPGTSRRSTDAPGAEAAARPDPRPAQGTTVTLRERLSPGVLTPYVPRVGKPRPRRVPPEPDPWPLPLMAIDPPPLRRVYVAVGRSRKGRTGPPSARVGVPLVDVPPAPSAPVLRYTETAILVEWTPSPLARLPIQQPATPDSLPVRLLFPGRNPHTYNVYASGDVQGADPETAGALPPVPRPLNASPLVGPPFEDSPIVFGVERCYEVRTVEVGLNVAIESEPSPRACITPVDTFPPAPPRGLAAVGSEGAINLIWDPNTEGDLAGYLVLRGEAGSGAPLQVLTPAPIRETTYRDTAVVRGTRYVYAVVAVDAAMPANLSLESTRVEETAR